MKMLENALSIFAGIRCVAHKSLISGWDLSFLTSFFSFSALSYAGLHYPALIYTMIWRCVPDWCVPERVFLMRPLNETSLGWNVPSRSFPLDTHFKYVIAMKEMRNGKETYKHPNVMTFDGEWCGGRGFQALIYWEKFFQIKCAETGKQGCRDRKYCQKQYLLYGTINSRKNTVQYMAPWSKFVKKRNDFSQC